MSKEPISDTDGFLTEEWGTFLQVMRNVAYDYDHEVRLLVAWEDSIEFELVDTSDEPTITAEATVKRIGATVQGKEIVEVVERELGNSAREVSRLVEFNASIVFAVLYAQP